MNDSQTKHSVPQFPLRIMDVTPAPYGLCIGDTITIPAYPDHRNWWQRRAPKWLGGQDAPRPFEGTITSIVGGSATFVEDREP